MFKKFILLFLISYCNLAICFSQNRLSNTKTDFKTIEYLYKNKNYQELINYRKPPFKTNDEKAIYYSYCANAYRNLGEYSKSISFFNQAIIHNKNKKKELITNYIDIAKTYAKLKTKASYKKSISFLLEAFYITESYPINNNILFKLHNNIANYYSLIDEEKKAFYHYNKALSTAEKNQDSKSTQITLINLGNIYLSPSSKTEELQKALYYNKKAIEYKNEYNVYAYTNLGIIKYLQDEPKNALVYHNKALESLLNTTIDSLSYLPTINSIKDFYNKELLLDILFEKTYAWVKLHEQTKNKNDLLNALKTVKLSDTILNLLLNELTEEKSQLFWRQQASHFYLLGVHISHLLNTPKKAFYFTEKNKAVLLLTNTIRTGLKNTLPERLIKKESQLKKEITSLQIKYAKKKSDSLQNALFIEKQKLFSFTDSLKTVFPVLNTINKIENIKSYKQVQNELKPNTAIVSYIWDKEENQYDALYGVLITKDTSRVFKINDLKTFDKKVIKFRDLVSKPFSTQKELKLFQQTAFSLYTDLFPINIEKLINNKDLIIIPDNDLQNIPFEALITKTESLNYLIYSNEISYTYSISFLKESQKLFRSPSKRFLGMAPFSFNYDSLPKLNNSLSEIEKIHSKIQGVTFTKENATKKAFIRNSNHYSILHLATHANATDKSMPWIAFKKQKLYLNELYTLKNQANLVVLSTCETAIGEIANGEGALSLARGFFYSGAKSVLSSLWNVNDKSTSTLMVNFYENLKQNQPKSKALHNAKLKYLKTHSFSEASPYYWSSFILIGDTAPIPFNSQTHWYFYILLITIILFTLFFKNKIKKNNILMGNKREP